MSYTRYIHNVSGGEKTYRGVPIANNAFYEIGLSNLIWYQTSDDVMADLASDDIRMSADGTTDYSTETAKNIAFLLGTEPNPVDADNSIIVRTKAAQQGWTYHMHCIQFESSVLSSIVEKDENDDDTSYGTIKFYNSSDVELTTQGDLDSSCVKTVIDYEPTFDYEIIGGKVQNKSTPSNSFRLFVVAVPDLTYAQGGSRVMENNVDISYLNANSEVNADGRASKYMTYNATYHTNKLRVVMYHAAGEKVKFQMIYEMYRA